jgi:hypothetical protein
MNTTHSEEFLNTEQKRVRALELVIGELMEKSNRSGSLQVESIVWHLQKEVDDVFQELEEYARCMLRSYK